MIVVNHADVTVERVVKAIWKEVLHIDLPEFPHITYDYAMTNVSCP